ncbi:uncharacterized protein LOC129290012 [Prosopis cineraria]|uniref:uncharacterized protein LOC129290012 n=1 Tax=Prosopis cineraria TaxID=364024 RepID=UPI00240EDB75|nr:uncharacterized protein LOC129290012 [Prosopis cineraria]
MSYRRERERERENLNSASRNFGHLNSSLHHPARHRWYGSPEIFSFPSILRSFSSVRFSVVGVIGASLPFESKRNCCSELQILDPANSVLVFFNTLLTRTGAILAVAVMFAQNHSVVVQIATRIGETRESK